MGGTDITIDFVDLAITSVVFSAIVNFDESTTIAIALDKEAVTDFEESPTPAAFEYGELLSPTSITVQSWVETTIPVNYATVDTAFASEVVNVTFVDPSSVSVITRVERFATGTADSGLFKATRTVAAVSTGAETVSTTDAGHVIDGVTLDDGDFILLKDQASAIENGLYEINANGTAPTATSTDVAATVFAFVTGGTANRGKVFTGDGSDAVTEYTTAGTINALNAGGSNFLGASVDFSNSQVNLTQVDLAKWSAETVSSVSDDFTYQSASVLRPVTPSGFTTIDGLGRILVQAPINDLSADDGATYQLKMKHSGDTVAPILEYTSPGFQIITSPSDDADLIGATTATTGTSVGTYASGYPVTVRNGTSAVTFTSQVREDDTTDRDLEVANVPVMAVVTAGANLPAGETLVVSGSTSQIEAAGQDIVVNGLTNSDGEWDVTVTSSDTSSAGAAYTVQFYVLDGAGTDVFRTATGVSTDDAIYNVDYAAAGLATTNAFTADSTVLSGANVTVAFSVVDQFGEPMSSSSTGKAYSVELRAPNKTNLDLSAAVVGGTASFTFANFVGVGASDVLTAKLYTGTATAPTYVTNQSVQMTLYNTNAVAGVNVTDSDVSVTVVYEDFITGLASSTNVAPTATALALVGSVVDSNGAGIPGAPVTLSGSGFQFLKTGGTSYAVDSITLNTDAAGVWSVDMWTHSSSTTGKDNLITVASGALTTSIEVIAAVPTAMSAGNMRISWNLPSNPVYNTTYAVTGTVTDVWGNPVTGIDLTFAGEAAAQFNSLATVTKRSNASGQATVYLRSLKDVSGLAAVSLTAAAGSLTVSNIANVLTDVKTTSWDESTWTNPVVAEITFLTSEVVVSADQKVNVGSFKGYVALYAKGYEGQKMSAIVAGKWIVVESLASDFERVVRFTGAGYTITTKLYIDGEQVGDAFTTLTK
jgi:hypothetical protein